MEVRLVVCVTLACAAVQGCSRANASGFDPNNPLHCATQFQVYEIIARQQGDGVKASGYGARSEWYAEHARSLPAEQLTPAALTALGNKIAAQKDGGYALSTACLKQQDADPDFQRRVHEAKRSGSR